MDRRIDQVEFETMLMMRHWYSQERRADADLLLERSAYILLSRIELDGPVSIGQLSESLGLDVSTLNRQTAALMRSGLLKRIPDPDGGIARKFQLSTGGKDRLQAHRGSNTDSLDRIMEAWTPEEIAEFAAALTRFNQDIERRLGRSWPRHQALATSKSAD